MNADEAELEKLEFPLTVHFKVIGVYSEDLRTHLEIALWELNIRESIKPGNMSAKGNYITYNLTTTVFDRERLRAIDARLRAVEGVRMVL
ncbi:MAG TPA: DUF493 domain-containing protein [Kiritimatiellia bacterium]|nr:DUF493 domain-containing protein [Kiritimatiellia bacterium]HMO99197.1 DUF493 domain-containing protein [Kiritimatiellia bacterium]HMP95784.1 DUF493 domain-containing protein [Kiritimatiellia bacterium]